MSKASNPARRHQLNPQASGDPIAQGAQASSAGPRKAADVAKAAKAEGQDVVQVLVPRTFRLTADDRVETEYKEGVCQMPAAHFEHPYVKANGVKLHRGE